MAERAVGDAKDVGGFGLDAAALGEGVLQERAFDAGYVAFHPHAGGESDVGADFGQS